MLWQQELELHRRKEIQIDAGTATVASRTGRKVEDEIEEKTRIQTNTQARRGWEKKQRNMIQVRSRIQSLKAAHEKGCLVCPLKSSERKTERHLRERFDNSKYNQQPAITHASLRLRSNGGQ